MLLRGGARSIVLTPLLPTRLARFRALLPTCAKEAARGERGSGRRVGRSTVLRSLLPLPLATMYGYAPPSQYTGGENSVISNGGKLANSVLSGYFLPNNMQDTADEYAFYDNSDDDYVFAYPKGWVLRPNGQRPGVSAGNFRTADRVTVDIIDAKRALPSWPKVVPKEVSEAAALAAIAPDSNGYSGNGRQFLPSRIKVEPVKYEGDDREYYQIEFSSTTITRTGYDVRKGNIMAATLVAGNLFVINASARSDTYDAIEDQLRGARASFRIREGADERVARRDLAKESLQELDAGVTRPAGYGGVEGLDLADDEDDMCAGISDSAGIC